MSDFEGRLAKLFEKLKNIALRLFSVLRSFWNIPYVKLFLQIIFVGLALFFVFYNIYENWTKIQSYQWHVDWMLIVLAFIVLLFHRLLGASGWYIILKVLIPNQPMPSFRKILGSFSISNLASYIPGTYWALLSRVYLSREMGFTTYVSTLSLVIETILNVISAVIVILLFVVPVVFPEQIWLLAPSFFLIFVLILVASNKKIVNLATSFYNRIFHRNVEGFTIRLKELVLLLLIYCLEWAPLGISLSLVLRAIYPENMINVFSGIGYFTAAWMIGFVVPVAPAGLGIREAALVYFLQFESIPDPFPAMMAILFRIFMSLEDVFWGVLAKIQDR